MEGEAGMTEARRNELDNLVGTLSACINARLEWQKAVNRYSAEHEERVRMAYDGFLDILQEVLSGGSEGAKKQEG